MVHQSEIIDPASVDNSIVEEFALLGSDPSLLLGHLISVGSELPSFSEAEKKGAHLVPGCLAKVWLIAEYGKSSTFFRADSDAAITKGLAALLVRVFSGATPTSIRGYSPRFPAAIGLDKLLGGRRRNGLNAMIKIFDLYAGG